MVDSPADDRSQERPIRDRSGDTEGGSPFALYKSGQGTYVRWGSALGAGIVTIAAAMFAYDRLSAITFVETASTRLWIQTGVALGVLAGLAILGFRLIGQSPRVVDFLIATENEMRKVNWSSRKEVWGATKVVIATVLLMGLALFIVDLLFMSFFSLIGVIRMPMPILQTLFGGAQ
ncbi:MAG: preprotein translocase subunit SecE [Planctomycetia bacterium]|nr:MAG: preprotein translocase subunit SecE [Planctomycetia bacterium]